MSNASEIKWEIDSMIQQWLSAYPKDLFPDLSEPPTPRETLRAVMLARHILESLSVDIEAICMNYEQEEK